MPPAWSHESRLLFFHSSIKNRAIIYRSWDTNGSFFRDILQTTYNEAILRNFFSAWMQTYQLKLHVQLTQNKKLRLLSMSIIFFIALRRYKIKEFKNFSFSSPRFHILQSPFSFSPADSVLLGLFWTWGDYYEIERIEVTEVRNENRRAIPLCPPNPF